MEHFIIRGRKPLNGTVKPSGNKNSALPLLAACLLTDQPVLLHNVPNITDVLTMRRLIESLGATVEEVAKSSWRIECQKIDAHTADAELCRQIRASILLAGPMMARHGVFDMPAPGGDVIGRRRLDTHILALQALGAKILHEDVFRMHADGLYGCEILLDEASVTATENAIMAGTLAQGTTVLRNAACEPHVQELCTFLNHLGAGIDGIGSNVLTIEGSTRLTGGEFTIGPDYLEVISFVGAAAVTGGEICIKDAARANLSSAEIVFGRLGVKWELDGEDLLVREAQSLEIVPDLGGAIPKVDDAPWPGFPADLMSVAIVVATQCSGTVLFHEKLFESRLYFVDKLVGMGAHIIVCDPHRCIVQGPSSLQAEILESPDIRAGVAVVLAALCARGESVIRNVGQIERGYESIDDKLRGLGADIRRISDVE